MATLASYYLYSNLPGRSATSFDEFKNEVCAFSRTRLLHLCSAMNMLLRAEDDSLIDRDAHDSLVRMFFNAEHVKILLKGQGDVRFVFHRQQLLSVAKVAVKYGSENGLPTTQDNHARLGLMFLMANEHLAKVPPTPEAIPEKFAYFASQMLVTQEASGFHRFDHKIARSYVMIEDCLPALKGKAEPYFDVPNLFLQNAKLPLDTFQALLFGLLSKFNKKDLGRYAQDWRTFGVSGKWFESTTIKPEPLSAFLDLVSATPDELKTSFEKADWGANDFTPFRNKPLFRDGDYLFPLDFAFVAEKFESCPFWTVHESLPDKKSRDDLHAFWGKVFEEYGTKLLENSSNKQYSSVFTNPQFVDKEKGEVCDSLVVCGNAAVFVEFKGFTFTSRSKYEGNYERFMGEIDKKLVSDDGENKAVMQLKRSIELVAGEGLPIEGVDLNGVDGFYPLIVTRDDVGSVFGVAAYLQSKFETALDRKKLSHYTTPLFTVDAEDIERISAYFGCSCLAEMLSAHLKSDQKRGEYLLNPFFASPDNGIVQSHGPLVPEVSKNAWDRLTKFTAKHLGLKN